MRIFTVLFSLLISLNLAADPAVVTEFIKTDQFGYRPGDIKIAVIANPVVGFNSAESFAPGDTYEVRRAADDVTVYSGSPTAHNGGEVHEQSGDEVWWFDFSEVNTPGEYYVFDAENAVGSYNFRIEESVYAEVMRQAVRVFYYQRCGSEKTEAHGGAWHDAACHTQDTECRPVTNPDNAAAARDLSGGWHDAGDYNKYTNFAYAPVHALLFAYESNPAAFTDDYNLPASGNNIPDILDELIYELDWLQKMQNPDGSLLMKVSVTGFQADSPPSADAAERYYGEAAASATATGASVFAHSYSVLKDFPDLSAYADHLLERAEDAWAWLQENPALSTYDNSGFSSANPEDSAEEQAEKRTGAAMLLYRATGAQSYRDYADANYTDIRPIAWDYWYPFQPTIQDIALCYADFLPASSAVRADILESFTFSTTGNNPSMFPAYQNQTDAYRAFLADNDYVWGSNMWLSVQGNMYSSMNRLGLNMTDSTAFKNAALGYVHRLHGINPLTKVMLTHADGFGADNFCNEMYHAWFDDNTIYDNAETSATGPAPGFVTGGVNPYFAPDPAYGGTISPPQNQPVLKSYKDWNSTWPENSWEITEPAIYYQAAYIQLLAPFTQQAADMPVSVTEAAAEDLFSLRISPNPATQTLLMKAEGEENLEEVRIALYDSRGVAVLRSNFSVGGRYFQTALTVGDLPRGIYFVRTETAAGSLVRRVILQ